MSRKVHKNGRKQSGGEITNNEILNNTITFYVSGEKFVTTRETLARFPTTRIGKLAQSHKCEYFFDTNEQVFREVLEYHRTGTLHAPKNICSKRLIEQLEYWGVNYRELKECCQSHDINETKLEKQFCWFENKLELETTPSGKTKVWYFLTDPLGPYTAHRNAAVAWIIFYCLVIIAQTANAAAYTIPPTQVNATNTADRRIDECNAVKRHFGKTTYDIIWTLEEAFFTFFLLEITVRFICSPNKRQFLCSMNMVDVLIVGVELLPITVIRIFRLTEKSILGSEMCLVINLLVGTMTVAVQMRCFRLMMLATRNTQLRVLLLTIYNSKTEIGLLITVVVMSSLIFGPAMYVMEFMGKHVSNSTPNLDSIPASYWWVIVTMSSVGYGDFYPTNIFGYLLAIVVIMFGLIVTALPVAIIGANFTIIYKYNKKRSQQTNNRCIDERERGGSQQR
ncbi:potassium voltage-gated channel subfamily B member 2-like [Watersipora subatra]|uniref:potassium voltage-gated channel subfamily B member 2-like n=1 Tax=Watersipora subatra TaxID=2589382 RepID=UPI00355BEDA5